MATEVAAEGSNNWQRESGFIWSVLGSAIGFANILSFSAQCYKNGGGAFLIPLFLAYLLLGIPLLVLEATIGQRFQLPMVSAYGQATGWMGRAIGWLSILACTTIGAFYTVLTGYAVAYTYFAMTGQIPTDTATFFKQNFIGDTGSLSIWGSFSWTIGLATLAVCVVTWWVLTRQVKSGVERICSIFMPLMVAIIVFFAILTLFLPGAFVGLSYFLTPDFSRLTEFSLWRDVFGHLFFSLSLGLGIITGFARYSGRNIHVGRAMRWVVLGDATISFLAGMVIFSCLGYLSTEIHVPFTELVKTDSIFELGFILFPKVLQTLTGWLQPALGGLFFFCIFIAGITGVFSIIESVAGNVEVEYRLSRQKAVVLTLAIVGAGACFFCMGNGQHILGALAPMVLGFNMLLAGVAEIVIFLFFVRVIRQDVVDQVPLPNETFAKVYGGVLFAILAVIFVGAVQSELFAGSSLAIALRWIWFGVAVVLSVGLSLCSPSQRREVTSGEVAALKATL